MDIELEFLDTYEKLHETIDEVGYLLLQRKVAEEEDIDRKIQDLMTANNVNSVSDLEEIIEFKFTKSREDSDKRADILLKLELEEKEQKLKENSAKEGVLIDKLKSYKQTNLKMQIFVQSLIERLVELDESIQEILREQDEEYILKREILIRKNIMMSTFIIDLISAISSIDVSSSEELINIIYECGDYSIYQ